MPEIHGVRMYDPGRRQGRHDKGPIRPLTLLKSATGHDLRGAEIIVAANGIGLAEAYRVSSSVVATVALLLALRRCLLTRLIHILHSRRCRLREQL